MKNCLRLGVGLGSVLAAAALGTSVAFAATLPFTFTGSVGGNAENISGTIITTSTTIEVQVSNLQANPANVVQALSGIFITLSAAPSSVGATSSPQTTIDITSNTGPYTTHTGVTSTWGTGVSGNVVTIEGIGPFSINAPTL